MRGRTSELGKLVEMIPTDINGWSPRSFCGDGWAKTRSLTATRCPEPATLTLLELGLAGVARKLDSDAGPKAPDAATTHFTVTAITC